MTPMQNTLADLVEECAEQGFETPFWMEVTDQAGNALSVICTDDLDQDGIKATVFSEDQHDTFIFPLEIDVTDHAGRRFAVDIYPKQ